MVVTATIMVAVAAFGTTSAFHLPAASTGRTFTHLNAEHKTGVARNPNFAKLQGGYLFPEIGRRRSAYLKENPDGPPLISLGIGDTTMPIPEHILSGLASSVSKLGAKETYTGYGDGNGEVDLREKIASELYGNRISPNEVFVSDGAKCDIGRLQVMLGAQVVTAVQDPSYPVYVDTAVMMGQTGEVNAETSQFKNMVYMPCNPDNGWFPDLAKLPHADVIHFCSPNNPTGACATREQLTQLVDHAIAKGSIIIFDAAYAPFIRTAGTPKSIYEIPGAEKCAIEVNSFSKYAGFTGVRLGWTIVPEGLMYADGSQVKKDYERVMSTAFNGASNIVQGGGMACLDPEGMKEIEGLISYYLENAKILKKCAEDCGFEVHGGDNAPYVFMDLKGASSWDMFSKILSEAQVVTIPGAGFGPGGEGFLRLSAFASRENCEEAAARLVKMFKK